MRFDARLHHASWLQDPAFSDAYKAMLPGTAHLLLFIMYLALNHSDALVHCSGVQDCQPCLLQLVWLGAVPYLLELCGSTMTCERPTSSSFPGTATACRLFSTSPSWHCLQDACSQMLHVLVFDTCCKYSCQLCDFYEMVFRTPRNNHHTCSPQAACVPF